MTGVYAIRNKVNGRCYFGSTIRRAVAHPDMPLSLAVGLLTRDGVVVIPKFGDSLPGGVLFPQKR